MYQIFIRGPEGDEIELVATEEQRFGAGVEAGTKALLNLFKDEMDLEEGYSIVTKKDGHRTSFQDYMSQHY